MELSGIKLWVNETAWFILKCLMLIVMIALMVILIDVMVEEIQAPLVMPDWANITNLEG